MTEAEKTMTSAEQANSPIDEMTFEQAAAELDSIVEQLNSGSVQLDGMIALYERGVALSDRCMQLLKEYDGRIEKAVRRSAPTE
ncbi:MAG: exodeoxyribonuclease VII small subunit [Clostridia bacterium]|nr:exodeoxyribonuclease VII small subunit [Clostridia bacterium]